MDNTTTVFIFKNAMFRGEGFLGNSKVEELKSWLEDARETIDPRVFLKLPDCNYEDLRFFVDGDWGCGESEIYMDGDAVYDFLEGLSRAGYNVKLIILLFNVWVERSQIPF